MKINPDKPFRLKGGAGESVALFNRIAAIERINYIIGGEFDLRKKSDEYKQMLDLEMYQLWYRNLPKDHLIDEEWCQRAAKVIKDMEKDPGLTKALTGVRERVETAYQAHRHLEDTAKKKKESWYKRILKGRSK